MLELVADMGEAEQMWSALGALGVGNWIALVGVLISLVFGGIAWRQGHAANGRAENAENEAERLAKRLDGLGADLKAVKGAAVDTRKLAEDANGISRGLLTQVQESHDVDWDGRWEGNTYAVWNTGHDEAIDVHGFVEIDGTKREVQVEHVGAGGVIRLEFPEVVRQYRKDMREARATLKHTFVAPPGLAGQQTWVTMRLYWKSKGGVAHKHCPNDFLHDPDE
ncbi:hypothetical protein [Brachybacterium kimchii]|uniref:Uncharacterized protein n=1 Tax=Brachybacterium kimchii TaxID=2942909 RepID=A0ABY4N9A6_9MICO|nr:hypothetical protein [Brachybacterium kimchii]UQN30691.1 hypothetical protein M4486_05145 [Brachybacterium kimchii]